MRRRESIWYLIFVGAIFVVLISAPYLIANQTSGSEKLFGGFLFNPIDGNSYLAKMYQGSMSSWLFKFPYTAESGEGAYIFLFYLALGKLAELSGLTLQFAFHISRLAGSILMFFALWNFYSKTLDTKRSRWLAFGLALFGSGLGWLAALFGAFTADFWVAEGYPFLSAYANPHFPLGLAVLIFLLTPQEVDINDRQDKVNFRPGIIVAAGALLLGIILPFGVVIAAIVYALLAFWEIWELKTIARMPGLDSKKILETLNGSESLKKLLWLLIGGLPIIIYYVWLTISNPIFANWNTQNLTASPPVWDLFISYAPMFLLAIPGAWLAFRAKNPSTRVLIIWAVISALLIYLPWGLQRRFLLGYAIPLAGLAGIGLDELFIRRKVAGLAVLSILIILVIPTNAMVIMGGFQAIDTRDERIYLSQEEILGMEWIASQSSQDALILASPNMGLYIPAYTGRVVYYGHPFETANAEKMEAVVTHFFDGTINDVERAMLADADYIFYGPREKALGTILEEPAYQLVYSTNALKIFKIDHQSSGLNGEGKTVDS